MRTKRDRRNGVTAMKERKCIGDGTRKTWLYERDAQIDEKDEYSHPGSSRPAEEYERDGIYIYIRHLNLCRRIQNGMRSLCNGSGSRLKNASDTATI